MSQNLVFALHGFLGRGEDWKQVQSHCDSSIKWVAPNLFSKDSLRISEYTKYVDQLFSKNKPQGTKKIFIGYSLGGRLGLHLLKKFSAQFDHFIFVSVNPGLLSETEGLQRLASDAAWAEKLKTLSWDQFLTEWNNQPVFSKADAEPIRLEKDFDRDKLVQSLDTWSLGRQEDLRAVIQKHQHKITWVVGENDSKFLNIAEDLKQKKILLGYNKIFSGHRILFSNPSELAAIITKSF